MTVSWGTAFKGSLLIIVYSLGWVIVGGAIFALGYVAIAQGLISTFTGAFLGGQPSTGGGFYLLLGGTVMMIAGTFVIVFGTIASQLKVQTDVMADEVERRINTMAILSTTSMRARNPEPSPPSS